MEVMKEYKISAQYLKNYKYDNQDIYNTLSLTQPAMTEPHLKYRLVRIRENLYVGPVQ